MNKALLFVAFLIGSFGLAAWAQAEDVVYLKDGSVIHGTITEEQPGVSLKIETKDGNVFVYKVKQVSKITHSAAAPAATDDQGDDSAAAAPAAPPAEEGDTVVVVKHKRRPAFVKVNDFKDDPEGRFSVGALYFGFGFGSAGVVNQYNTLLNNIGANNYNFVPIVYTGDLGLAWYTNHIGLKWTFTYGFNWDYEQTDYYYGGYYIGSTYINNYIDMYGSELEADLSLDSVQTSASNPDKKRIFSAYIPFIVGFWGVDLVNENTGYDWYGTTVDYGTGLGLRFIGEDHIMFDIQGIYRFDTPGTMKNSTYGTLPLLNGKNMTADVSGFNLNCNLGFTF